MEKILVLLSTFNGEKYLLEQLKSIVNQKGVEVQLLVRDDGSSDHTIDILDEWKTKSNLNWYQGDNLRSARSFMNLCKKAASSASEFYAFSDQDDYWLPEKLSAGVNSLKGVKGPALYFSQTQLVDEKLSILPTKKTVIAGTFVESLIHYFVGGCTMVFNRPMLDLINRYVPQYLLMHDVWIYSLALSVNAKMVFDPVPHIYYRQHQNNVIGQKKGLKIEWQRRIKRLLGNECSRSRMAAELLAGYGDLMNEENRSLLVTIVNYKGLKGRLRLLFDKRFKVNKIKTDILFRLAVLSGRF